MYEAYRLVSAGGLFACVCVELLPPLSLFSFLSRPRIENVLLRNYFPLNTRNMCTDLKVVPV